MDNQIYRARLDAVHDQTTVILDSLLPRDLQGKGWVCPWCKNGSHDGGHGLKRTPNNPYRVFCFACGNDEYAHDVLDIAGEVLGLSSFNEKLTACENLAGIGSRTVNNRPPSPRPVQQKEQPKTNYTSFFRDAHKHIGETDYLRSRGISDAISQDERFFLGFAPFHLTGKVRNAIVFPTGKHSFSVRTTDPRAGHDARYRTYGELAPFAVHAMYTDRPCFVAEGAINALSIVEVGGNACALGSTSGVKAFLEKVDRNRPTSHLMICLDNDQAGELATIELCKALDDRKIRYSCVSLCRPKLDINDELRTDRTRLKTLVHDAERSF